MRSIFAIVSVLLLAFLVSFVGVAAQPVADSLPPVDYYDDGPHVFWKNDSTAMIIYVCQSALHIDTLHVTDTLRFMGACEDSAVKYEISAAPPAIEPHAYNNASKIFVVSDIHGEYHHFVDILMKGGVTDDSGQWVWGEGHLVVDGDVFDRGDRVTECLWLIYRLEQQAKEHGGRVHFVLGNHELMVIRGDNRYIHDRYLKGIARKSRIRHEDLFGTDMELGRWLRTKHTAVKINDILFVHGGIPPYLAEPGWSLSALNDLVRRNLDMPSSQLAFGDTAKLLYGSKGPLWYRGYHYEMEGKYPQACVASVDSILTFYDARTIVVGHTECASMHPIFGERIIAIDIPVEDVGSLEALLWQDGTFFRICGQGKLWPIEFE